MHSTAHPKRKWNNIVRAGKTPVHDKDEQENDPEVLVTGPSFVDWKRTDTAQNENLNENNKTKFTEKDLQHQAGSEKREPAE